MQRFQVHSHSQALTPTYRSLQSVASISVQHYLSLVDNQIYFSLVLFLMCLIVNYSKKLVKSDYLGVIICDWWRKIRKIGIFANQMLTSLEIHMKTPNTRDFCQNNIQFEHLYAECTKNSEHSMRFFQKIGKITILRIELTSNLTIWVEKSENWNFQ